MYATKGPLASEPGAGKAMAIDWKPREPNSFCSLFMVWATRKQCADLRKRNSITTTLPLKLESRVVLPEGSLMANSGDLRSTSAEGEATAPVASTRRTTMDVSLRIDHACFHLSAMRWISAAAAAAASSGLRSPFRTLCTILGTREVVKTSIYAGVANPGTPRLGVQCSAS